MGVSHFNSQETKPGPILITESEASGTRKKQATDDESGSGEKSVSPRACPRSEAPDPGCLDRRAGGRLLRKKGTAPHRGLPIPMSQASLQGVLPPPCGWKNQGQGSAGFLGEKEPPPTDPGQGFGPPCSEPGMTWTSVFLKKCRINESKVLSRYLALYPCKVMGFFLRVIFF